jgi:hypothetical protein
MPRSRVLYIRTRYYDRGRYRFPGAGQPYEIWRVP